MTTRTIAAGLGLALALTFAMAGCSKPADTAAKAGPGAGRAGAPKPPADLMAGAKPYSCENGSTLRVVINKEKTAATVRLDDGVAVYLPREDKPGVDAYSDGDHTLGISAEGDFAYTEEPAPPKVCRAAEDEPPSGREPTTSDPPKSDRQGKAAPELASASGDLPAPKVAGVTRNLTAADKGKTIEIKVGEKISISLVGIPTAGYVWAADTTPPFVKVSDGPSGPTIAAQNQPGYAGGNHWEVLVVEAVKPGEGDLVLAMRRPWESKAEPDAEKFTVTLKAR
jgi:predicted secreted protein